MKISEYAQSKNLQQRPDGSYKVSVESRESPRFEYRATLKPGETFWELTHPTNPTFLIPETELSKGYILLDAGADPEPQPLPFLQKAHNLINGERQADYGSAYQNFTQIAKLWSALFAAKLSKEITAEEVAMGMQMVKMARLLHQPGHFDSKLDNSAYAALIDTVQEQRKTSPPLPGILGNK